MRRSSIHLGIGALLLAASWAQAQTYGGSATSPGADPGAETNERGDSTAGTAGGADTMGIPGANGIQGRVQNFDRSDNTLTIAGKDEPLKVDSSTQVLRNGKEASLSDVKEGDEVRASYSGTGDDLHVERLELIVVNPVNPAPRGAAPPEPRMSQEPGTSVRSGFNDPEAPQVWLGP